MSPLLSILLCTFGSTLASIYTIPTFTTELALYNSSAALMDTCADVAIDNSTVLPVVPMTRERTVKSLQRRPSAEADMMEKVYLFLAVLVMFSVVNLLLLDYVFGGPIFPEEALADFENELVAMSPVGSEKVATTTVKKTLVKKTVRPAATRPCKVAQSMAGSDTEC